MVQPAIDPATLEDILELAPRVRQADADEMRASHGLNPMEGLTQSLALSTHAWAGKLDGRVVCVFGVAPATVLTGDGMPWFVASDDIARHQILFLRFCKPVVHEMLRMYPRLFNWVDARNRKAIRWLKWLGFELHPAKPWGYTQMPFHKFEMRG